jgi:V8-like Glu-specific endopeptidase
LIDSGKTTRLHHAGLANWARVAVTRRRAQRRKPIGVSMKLLPLLLCGALAVPFASAQNPSVAPNPDLLVPVEVTVPLLANHGSELLLDERWIDVPGAGSLRVIFASATLGAADFIEAWSPFTGETHRLDRAELAKWSSTSAYFNGDRLRLRLSVAPGSAAGYSVAEVICGYGPAGQDTICGADDRIASTDNRSLRLVSSPTSPSGGCTVWLAGPDGFALTAGHCGIGGNSVAEANVPPSLSTGTAQHPPVQFQFPIVSLANQNGGQGNDWHLCRISPNNLGQSPSALFGWFVLAATLPSANQTIRITGFGTDSGVQNVTNQTSTGPYSSTSGTALRYAVDTEGGNSGSPVIVESTGEAIGIHTHGGCTSTGGANTGTSLSHAGFQAAYRGVLGPFPVTLQLAMSTGGGGAGDFHLQLASIPAGAVQGFTLFSFDTSFALGNGTLLGIRADAFTLAGLSLPALPNSPFHFAAPWSPSHYPLAAFDLPPGTLPYAAGTRLDAEVVVFGPGFSDAAWSNVVRITF